MGLVVYWYDIVCFAIVGVAVVGAFVVLIRTEGHRSRRRDEDFEVDSAYETLLLNHQLQESWIWYAKRRIRKGHIMHGELWLTCCLCCSPFLLMAFRAIAFVVLVLLLAWDIKDWGLSIFIYYTEWTFALVAVYFAMATWISFKGCMESVKKNSSGNQDQLTDSLKTDAEQGVCTNGNTHRSSVILQSFHERKENRKKTGLLGYTMQVIFQTCGGAVMMTDIVFWGIIVPFLQTTRFQVNTLMACMHSVNFIFLFIDAMLNSMHFPWFRGAYFVLWTAGYVIFQWILHACGFTWWPYPFLELSTPWAPVWYLGLAVLCVVCYALFWLLVKAKEWLFPKIFPNSYRTLL